MKKFSKIYNSFSSTLTNIRLEPYQRSFDVNNNHELIGAYLWGQQVSGSLYPLFHFIEIFVRNSIDYAVKSRMGEFWWEKIDCNHDSKSSKNFQKNIKKSIDKLTSAWIKSEKKRTGKKFIDKSLCPPFSHDQIIASTDFSTWTQVLTLSFHASSQDDKQKYIWPISLGKVFPQYNLIKTSSKDALVEIHNMLDEIREYRNRIFHHEPFWIKGKTAQLTSVRAIQTIREKISTIEKIIELLGKKLHSDVMQTNIFNNARRICSTEYLNIYQEKNNIITTTKKQKRTLRKKFPISAENTVCIEYKNNLYSICQLV